MDPRHAGGRSPPSVRDELTHALALLALEPETPRPVPFDYSLYRKAQRLGVPPWVLEGYRLDRPPVDWVIRCLEYAALEASVQVKRG